MQNFNYQMPPGAEDMIKRSHEQVAEQERRNLRALYQNARPGADYLTDSAYIRDAANLDKALEQRLADELTKGGLQYAGTELGRQNDLIGYDQGQNMLQYGEDTQKADDYRKSFSNVGSMLTSSGLGDVMSGFNPTQDPLQLNPEESQNQQNSWQNIMQQFLKQMGA